MRRALATLFTLGLAVASRPAFAETELVAFPVAATPAELRAVQSALNGAGLATAAKSIDEMCAMDNGCLVRSGTEVGARRVVSVTVVAPGKLALLLVDVGARVRLGSRDLQIAPKKLASDLGPAVARFVDGAILEKAKALFAEGNDHYNIGEYLPALDKYKLAFRVKPLPAFQFNIAQCHRKLGQHREAIAMYQAYLTQVPDAQNRTVVDSLIAESRQALEEQTRLDEERERDRLAAERQKAEQLRRVKEAEAAARAEAARVEQAKLAAERERQFNRHPARSWMLLTGGLGLAVAGAGAYFGVQSHAAQGAFDDAGCGSPGTLLGQAALATCLDDRDRGERNAMLANVLAGSGGVIVLASLVVYALDPGNVERPDTASGTRVAVDGNGIKVVVRW